jgi:anion-transporting  ArsA/GET3 family ATPase
MQSKSHPSDHIKQPALGEQRVLFVVGKGGVGKSVITASLGLAASARGERVCIAEMNGAESVSTLLGCPPVGYPATKVAEGLDAISISPEKATEDYLVRALRFRKLYDLVFRNRYIEPFMNGILGLSDLCSIGKVMDLEWQREDGSYGPDSKGPYRYDRILVDCPATGHGLALLRAAQTMMDVTRAGPLYNNSAMIAELLEDRSKTAVLLVTLPEEMPVTETLESVSSLRSDMNIALNGIVINAVPAALASTKDLQAFWSDLVVEAGALGGHAAAAARHGEERRQVRRQADAYISRLSSSSRLPVLELPKIAGSLGVDELHELGALLEGWQQ